MTRLQDLYANEGQSPWLDNLKRGWINDGELARAPMNADTSVLVRSGWL